MRKFRVGFIVNLIVGMGGRVVLKGIDGVVDEVIRRGVRLVVFEVVCLFLSELKYYKEVESFEFLIGFGFFGEDYFREFGFVFDVIRYREIGYCEIEGVKILDIILEDMKIFVCEMFEKVDIIVFVGGDGIVRDVYFVFGKKVLILGVFIGVKMFFGVFVVLFESVVRVFVEIVSGRVRLEERDVMDFDEDVYRRDEVRLKYYGKVLMFVVELFV